MNFAPFTLDWWLGGEMGAAGELVWNAPDWVILVAAAGALLALGASMLGERPLLARLAEVLLWGLALAGMVVALAQPMWMEKEGRSEAGRVAVLVDASRSMGVIEDGRPRSDAAQQRLQKLVGSGVDVYHFGGDLVVGEPSEFTLPATDLEGAIDALSERLAGEKLAGLAVVTDGLDRGLLRRRWKREAEPAAPILPGPLTVYQVGAVGDLNDLAVRSIDVGGYAFVRNPFRVRATLEGLGYEGRSVRATLLLDGETVREQRVKLDDEGNGEVVFEVVPEAAGRFTYAVSVPVYEGDAVPSNNLMPVVVRVVRDRIRVLQVAGAPSWDVKFLRRFLKGDPSVDLVSFFILRTNRDIKGEYEDRELSLIQFPYERLFKEDLWSFDVVIFQNFNYRPYFMGQGKYLLENMQKYVEERGGAFVMIGGEKSFGMGDYGTTPLAQVLPVKMVGPDVKEVADEDFRPALTAAGQRHPITRLVGDAAENRDWWERLQPMDGTNVVTGASDGAAVLLQHPTRTTQDGQPLPILAVKEAGAGRTMALTVDASWRWSLSEAAQGRGNQAYLRFWKNAMRWMMADPTVSRVTVDTPRENYGVGDEVRIVARVRDTDFAPLPGARVIAKVTQGGSEVRLEGSAGVDGEIVLSYPADSRGAHRVHVEVLDGDVRVGTAETVFAVTTRDPELDEVAPDEKFLRWLAARTDGRFYGPDEVGPVLTDPNAGRTVYDRRETALWRAPLLVFWIGLFAGLAWIVRRRSGLR